MIKIKYFLFSAVLINSIYHGPKTRTDYSDTQGSKPYLLLNLRYGDPIHHNNLGIIMSNLTKIMMLKRLNPETELRELLLSMIDFSRYSKNMSNPILVAERLSTEKLVEFLIMPNPDFYITNENKDRYRESLCLQSISNDCDYSLPNSRIHSFPQSIQSIIMEALRTLKIKLDIDPEDSSHLPAEARQISDILPPPGLEHLANVCKFDKSSIQSMIDENQFLENGKLTHEAKSALSEVALKSLNSPTRITGILGSFGIIALYAIRDKQFIYKPCKTLDDFFNLIDTTLFFIHEHELVKTVTALATGELTKETANIPDRSISLMLTLVRFTETKGFNLVIDAMKEGKCPDLSSKVSEKSLSYANKLFSAINLMVSKKQAKDDLENLPRLITCAPQKKKTNFIAMLLKYVFNGNVLKIKEFLSDYAGPKTDELKAIFDDEDRFNMIGSRGSLGTQQDILEAITQDPVSDDESDEKPIRLLPTFNVSSQTANPADDERDISGKESGLDLDVPQHTGASSSNQMPPQNASSSSRDRPAIGTAVAVMRQFINSQRTQLRDRPCTIPLEINDAGEEMLQ